MHCDDARILRYESAGVNSNARLEQPRARGYTPRLGSEARSGNTDRIRREIGRICASRGLNPPRPIGHRSAKERTTYAPNSSASHPTRPPAPCDRRHSARAARCTAGTDFEPGINRRIEGRRRQLAHVRRQLFESPVQSAHADHAGQCFEAAAALDVPDQHARQLRDHHTAVRDKDVWLPRIGAVASATASDVAEGLLERTQQIGILLQLGKLLAPASNALDIESTDLPTHDALHVA